jgi:hypothetical protein
MSPHIDDTPDAGNSLARRLHAALAKLDEPTATRLLQLLQSEIDEVEEWGCPRDCDPFAAAFLSLPEDDPDVEALLAAMQE